MPMPAVNTTGSLCIYLPCGVNLRQSKVQLRVMFVLLSFRQNYVVAGSPGTLTGIAISWWHAFLVPLGAGDRLNSVLLFAVVIESATNSSTA